MATREGHDPPTLVLETRMLPITPPGRCSIVIFIDGSQGFEPRSLAWKARMLPLHYEHIKIWLRDQELNLANLY